MAESESKRENVNVSIKRIRSSIRLPDFNEIITIFSVEGGKNRNVFNECDYLTIKNRLFVGFVVALSLHDAHNWKAEILKLNVFN